MGTLRLLTLEFLDFEKKAIALLLENYSQYFCDFTCWLSVELSLPFELLVCLFASFERNIGLIFYVIC